MPRKSKKAAAIAAIEPVRAKFNSIASMIDWLALTPRCNGANNASETGNDQFTGTATYGDAVKLAIGGWHEGARQVQAGVASASANAGRKIIARRVAYRRDVVGDECDVARFCAGDPECMVTQRRTINKGRTVRVVKVGVSASWKVTSGALMRYAVAVAGAVQRMEQAGQRVELWACVSAHDSQQREIHTLEVKIKSADSRLHMAGIAFATHPAMQRRFAFAHRERCAVWPITNDGYGRATRSTVGREDYLAGAGYFVADADVDAEIARISKEGGVK